MLYPPDLDGCLESSGLSIQTLQTDRSIIYILDAGSQIVFCNWAWDRFAFQNGGTRLDNLSVFGRSVLDVTPEPLQSFYSATYAAVRKTRQPHEHDFECSSPETFRFFHMRVLPIGGPYLCVENSLRIERAHDVDQECAQPVASRYVDQEGIVVMCCHCRRTRRSRNVGSDRWDWVPDFLNAPPGPVSHGLCEFCLRFFYPTAKPLARDKSGEKLA
jgi:hypothetical protein